MKSPLPLLAWQSRGACSVPCLLNDTEHLRYVFSSGVSQPFRPRRPHCPRRKPHPVLFLVLLYRHPGRSGIKGSPRDPRRAIAKAQETEVVLFAGPARPSLPLEERTSRLQLDCSSLLCFLRSPVLPVAMPRSNNRIPGSPRIRVRVIPRRAAFNRPRPSQ